MSQATQERAAFAEWLGRQHLNFDNRLMQIIYLPTGAPEDEVRLLEVNTGLYPDPGTPLVPVEMTPAVIDLPFRILVLDVTPDEWKKIQSDPNLLPTGWNLNGRQIIQRVQ
jgi:hypothetical protein